MNPDEKKNADRGMTDEALSGGIGAVRDMRREGPDPMTVEKPTDAELDAIYGAVLLRPGAESDEHCPALRAVFEAGVASQAARIAELEGELATTITVLGEAYVANEVLKSERDDALDKVDTLTRELAEETQNDKNLREEIEAAFGPHGGIGHMRLVAQKAKELAEAREELRLWAKVEKNTRGLTSYRHWQDIDSHRAKASTEKGLGNG